MKFNVFQTAYVTALAAFTVSIDEINKELDSDIEYQNLRKRVNSRKINNLPKQEFQDLVMQMSVKESAVEEKYNRANFREVLREAEKTLLYAFKEAVQKTEHYKNAQSIDLATLFNDLDRIIINLQHRQKLIDIAMKHNW